MFSECHYGSDELLRPAVVSEDRGTGLSTGCESGRASTQPAADTLATAKRRRRRGSRLSSGLPGCLRRFLEARWKQLSEQYAIASIPKVVWRSGHRDLPP